MSGVKHDFHGTPLQVDDERVLSDPRRHPIVRVRITDLSPGSARNVQAMVVHVFPVTTGLFKEGDVIDPRADHLTLE